MKMTMRYAHLSPAFLSAEVSLLDPPKPASPTLVKDKKSKRAQKGHGDVSNVAPRSRVPDLSCRNLAPRAGLEPATLRLTAAARVISTLSY